MLPKVNLLSSLFLAYLSGIETPERDLKGLLNKDENKQPFSKTDAGNNAEGDAEDAGQGGGGHLLKICPHALGKAIIR